MLGKQWKAINVTIPYKQTVMPYLDTIDQQAQEIGAVNTVVNKKWTSGRTQYRLWRLFCIWSRHTMYH